jgi:hypothetical protein
LDEWLLRTKIDVDHVSTHGKRSRHPRATAIHLRRQQLAAAGVVDGEHDALEMFPPNRGRDAGVGAYTTGVIS